MAADLHCHSVISDGSNSVEELVMLAGLNGLSAISVTDHDTLKGSELAAAIGEKYGVGIIKGMEISCVDNSRGRKVHLLCYMPKNCEEIAEIGRKTNCRRRKAVESAAHRVTELYPISYDMIVKKGEESESLYKQHIMIALMNAGYSTELFGELYRRLFNSRNGLAKTRFDYPDVIEVLHAIRRSGGVSVLAHPAVYDSYDLIPELIENGLDGIEVSYPRAKPSDFRLLGDICEQNGLIKTGGTDFHGRNGSVPHHIGTCTTDDDMIERIVLLAQKRAH